jgi:hypothetical protein
MIPVPTPEQLRGIALHEKEREERCKKILEKYKKQPKVKTEEEIKQEKKREWIKR